MNNSKVLTRGNDFEDQLTDMKMDLFAGSQKDEEFLYDNVEELSKFMKSEETSIAMPPANSYYRRLLHNLGKKFRLKTGSLGEGVDRHVIFEKTDESEIPGDVNTRQIKVWDFGDREFLVDPGQESVEVYLSRDGGVGIANREEKHKYIITRKVTSGSFKIKSNRIVEIQDEEW